MLKGIGIECNDDWVRDSRKTENSIFILSVSADLDYHHYAFMVLYFCFYANGEFEIFNSENLDDEDCSDLNDPVANVLLNYSQSTADSWKEGYKLIVKIVEEAFKNSIPEVPEK